MKLIRKLVNRFRPTAPDPPSLTVSAFSRMFPPITIDAHLAAKERVAVEAAKFERYLMPDGSILYWRTGVLHRSDMTMAHGYGVMIDDHDVFGWPAGDERSPASL